MSWLEMGTIEIWHKISLLGAFIVHAYNQISILEWPATMGPPSPKSSTVANALILISIMCLLVDNRVLPKRYMDKMWLPFRVFIEFMCHLLVFELGMCCFWPKTEQVIDRLLERLYSFDTKAGLLKDMGGDYVFHCVKMSLAGLIALNVIRMTNLTELVNKMLCSSTATNDLDQYCQCSVSTEAQPDEANNVAQYYLYENCDYESYVEPSRPPIRRQRRPKKVVKLNLR